jgi:hypothetical protein
MAEDPPKNEKTARLPATATIPFPSKTGLGAAPSPQDTSSFRSVSQPLDAIKRSDYRLPQPQKEGVLGIFVAVIAVLAILVAFGWSYWSLRAYLSSLSSGENSHLLAAFRQGRGPIRGRDG